jgi:hypothetical protein
MKEMGLILGVAACRRLPRAARAGRAAPCRRQPRLVAASLGRSAPAQRPLRPHSCNPVECPAEVPGTPRQLERNFCGNPDHRSTRKQRFFPFMAGHYGRLLRGALGATVVGTGLFAIGGPWALPSRHWVSCPSPRAHSTSARWPCCGRALPRGEVLHARE